MKQLNCKHTIHDTRHTFASLLDTVAPPNALRSLLGHKQGDITTRVYTHKTIRELRKTIVKITPQWGRDNYGSDEESHWVTFPISFSECYSVVPCIIGGSSDSIKIYNFNKAGFEKVSYYNFQTNKRVSRPCLWLAVGKA